MPHVLIKYAHVLICINRARVPGTLVHFILSSTGNWSQKIWLDDVDCYTSSHNCIADCAGCPSAEYDDCSHSEDITVECSEFCFNL